MLRKPKFHLVHNILPLAPILSHINQSKASHDISLRYVLVLGPGVAQWLRRCATSRTVPRSIPGGVTGFFSDILHGPGVESAPSENEYQEHFLRVKAAGA